MEKTMILNNVSLVKNDEYEDKQTGEKRSFHYCELTLTDGIDTIIAELAVPGVKDAGGQFSYPQPELPCGVVYGVALEIAGRTWEKDGRSGYMNRVKVRKIARL